ncbi:hypothetical protein, partial [Marinobacter gelidimuriae]|uniref:hypothetical protein n=1 Tax=Marinobacter gelidimuriae TaxID=2739064 RepID=UPI00036533E0
MKLKLVTLTLLPFLLTGCIQESKEISIEKVGNQTYLINQKSKEAFIVSNERLIQLKKSNPTALKIGEVLNRKGQISKSRIEVDASIKFFESKALYMVTVKPVSKDVTDEKGIITVDKSNFEWYKKAIENYDSQDYIMLVITDSDGFKLHEQKIRISHGYVSMVGNGEDAASYVYEGAININAENSKYASVID